MSIIMVMVFVTRATSPGPFKVRRLQPHGWFETDIFAA
jgi:hypothetical protein